MENKKTEASKEEAVSISPDQYQKITALLETLTAENLTLKTDIGVMVSGFGSVAGMFGDKKPGVADIMKLMANPTELMQKMGPAIAAMQKYQVAPAPKTLE